MKKSKNEEESVEEVKKEEIESVNVPTFDIQPMDNFSDDNQDASSNGMIIVLLYEQKFFYMNKIGYNEIQNPLPNFNFNFKILILIHSFSF